MWSSATCSGLHALLVAGLILAATTWAYAQPVDPTLPQERVVGRPAAPAGMERLDPGRTGQSESALPLTPHLLWRARVQGGIGHPVSVDEHGAIVISSSLAQVVQIAPDGKVTWSVHTGRGAPLTAPVMTSDGTRVVIGPGPQLIGIDATGHLRFKRTLPAPDPHTVSPPLPLDNGGLAFSLDNNVLRVGPAGNVVSTTKLSETVDAILARAGSLLVVTNRGDVLAWRPPAAPSRIGSLGGQVDGSPALCSPHSLCAVVDHHRLVELDLDNGIRHVRLDNTTLSLLGSPAITRTLETRVLTAGGLVLGYDNSARETLRVALLPGSLPLGGGTAPGLMRRSTMPPVIVDRAGTLGFARPGLDAGVVTRSGELHTAKGTACASPVGVTPAGPHRMVVACHSGLLWLVGDQPVHAPRAPAHAR